jgi:FkbM family methyltransferase
VQHTLMVLLFLDKLRGKSTIFADIGANIGLHTFFVKSKYKDLPIIAFDPSPASWKYMELSIRYNNLSNIRLEKIALSETNGLLDFYNWGNESSADSLKDTGRVLNVKPNVIKVPAKRLDDIKDMPPITVIKMDCEGAELSILKGAIESLYKNRPMILLEFHPINKTAFNVTTEDIFCFLRETDYSLYSINFEPLNSSTFDELQKQCEENYIMLPNKNVSFGN